MVIVQLSVKTGKVEGYLIFRKQKKFNGPRNLGREEATEYKWLREESCGKSPAELLSSIEDLAQKYGLRYKYLPAEGYEVSKNRAWFIKKGLEGKVEGTTAILGLLASIFFLSANLTGNAISNLSLKNSNMIGVMLFLFIVIPCALGTGTLSPLGLGSCPRVNTRLLGIAGAFFYFRKHKSKTI